MPVIANLVFFIYSETLVNFLLNMLARREIGKEVSLIDGNISFYSKEGYNS